MGQPTQDQIEMAADLFQVTGKIYKVRVGRYRYIRLQMYTADIVEQLLITGVFGGRFIDHRGYRHMWEISKRDDLKRVISLLLPYIEGELGTQLQQAAEWAWAPTRAQRDAVLGK